MTQETFHGTTILAVRRGNHVVICGDGQVTLGSSIMKNNATKVRTLLDGRVITGFAGATADAFTLFEKFEAKLQKYQGIITRASIELAKEWRTDKFLRKLEAMMIVANKDHMFLISGNGDVIEPDEPLIAIGSGGNYALSAAKALYKNTNLSAKSIVEKSLEIAGDICIYTNHNHIVETID